MTTVRRVPVLAALSASVCIIACGGRIGPAVTATAPRSEALLILPGFGYSREAEHALRAVEAQTRAAGLELYVPTYISRKGLVDSRSRLRQFLREERLDRYDRVHVFAFIAGGWTLNPLVDAHELPNLKTVVYDRSPLQELAARIATDDLHLLTWLRYGSPVFDFVKTAYPPLTAPHVNVGLVVETRPTAFVKRRAAAARRYGPIGFGCDGLLQRHDDCVYLAMNHNEVYARFAEIWPELQSFIRTGRFTDSATRIPPEGDPFAERERQ